MDNLLKKQKFSIVTPSLNQSKWLKLCITSVADQEDIEVEHIVQDGGSKDGTLKWLTKDERVKSFVEKDNGMYDAINRGFNRANGDYFAYLNCDEQYLPGTLKKVIKYFIKNPDIDILFGGTLVVDEFGELICYRKAIKPSHNIILINHLPTFTCSTFFRSKIFSKYDMKFDTKYRDVSDACWVLKMINKRLKFATLPFYTSVFTETGKNMNLGENAKKEIFEIFKTAPLFLKRFRKFIIMMHRINKVLKGHYMEKDLEYSIYTRFSSDQRKAFYINKPKAIWRDRLGLSNIIYKNKHRSITIYRDKFGDKFKRVRDE